jgi:hypothetical protein
VTSTPEMTIFFVLASEQMTMTRTYPQFPYFRPTHPRAHISPRNLSFTSLWHDFPCSTAILGTETSASLRSPAAASRSTPAHPASSACGEICPAMAADTSEGVKEARKLPLWWLLRTYLQVSVFNEPGSHSELTSKLNLVVIHHNNGADGNK